MRPRLTREEQETSILFNKTSGNAEIFTYEKSWHKHIETKLGIEPTHENGFGAKFYSIPKRYIRKPLPPRQVSEESREKLAARLIEARNPKELAILNVF